VLVVGEAVNVSRFHCDNRSGDVTDARNGKQALERGRRPQTFFEVFLQLFAMSSDLKTLLVMHEEGHSVFWGDLTRLQEVSEPALRWC